MFTTNELDPCGAIVTIRHVSRTGAEWWQAHRTANGGTALGIEENPTNDNGTYYHPCTRFCTDKCVLVFCADSERGAEK